MSVLALATALLYTGATGAYVAFLRGRSDRIAAVARLVTAVAWLAHAADIGLGCVSGIHPADTPGQAMIFAAWLAIGAFLAVSLRARVATAGAVVASSALLLVLAGHFVPAVARAEAPQGASLLGRFHISLAVAGVALFGVAAALAGLYLVQERQLKRKQLGSWLARGPSLAVLESLANRFVVVGFPVFTVALVLGALWVARLGRAASPSPPQLGLAMVTWGAFAWLLLGRVATGWRGRRAAQLTLIGFAAAIAVLGLYLLRRALAGT